MSKYPDLIRALAIVKLAAARANYCKPILGSKNMNSVPYELHVNGGSRCNRVLGTRMPAQFRSNDRTYQSSKVVC